MRSRFDEQLIELNTEMIEMGNQIIRAINEAIEALIKRDVEKAKTIMENDTVVDHLQKKSFPDCQKLPLSAPLIGRLQEIQTFGSHCLALS